MFKIMIKEYFTYDSLFLNTQSPYIDHRFNDDYKDDFTENIINNTQKLHEVVNQLLCRVELCSNDIAFFKQDIKVNSGWRPVEYCKRIGLNPSIPHTQGYAVDLHDPKQSLSNFLFDNQDIFNSINENDAFYCIRVESYKRTKYKLNDDGWCHIDVGFGVINNVKVF